MVVMPLPWASCSMAAPDAESRLVIINTLMPLLAMLEAMVFIRPASFCAFWMSQSRLTFLHSALSASGSEVTQRWEDCVSGRMMPTLAPLPSRAPPEPEPLLVALLLALVPLPPAGAELSLVLSDEHAARASEAAAPTTTRPIALLRMGNSAFHGAGSTGGCSRGRRSRRNVVGGNISPKLHGGKDPDTELLPRRAGG